MQSSHQNNYRVVSSQTGYTIYFGRVVQSQPKEDVKVGEIIGYRCWNFKGGELRSITRNYVWEDGEASGNPWKGSEGGVYAFKRWRTALENAEQKAALAFLVPLVVGRVKMWGKVHEHDHGYRAEYAKVESLRVVIGSRRAFKRVVRNYSQICDTSQLVRQAVDFKLVAINLGVIIVILSSMLGMMYGVLHFLVLINNNLKGG